jgi:hypothetical protein
MTVVLEAVILGLFLAGIAFGLVFLVSLFMELWR